MGNEEYAEDEMEGLLEDLQLLPPDKERDRDAEILKIHLETLMLLTTTKEGRERLREVGVYYVIRETHLAVEDEGVREACERLVQVLMRGEEGEGDTGVGNGMKALERGAKDVKQVKALRGGGSWAKAEEEDSEDDKIVEV